MVKAHFTCLLLGATVAAATCWSQLIDKPSMTRLEFTAYEETRGATQCGYGFRLTAGAGIGFPNMDDINDYVDWINDSFGGSIDTIDQYYSYRVQLDYPIYPNLRLGLAYDRMDAETDGALEFMGDVHHFEMDLEVEGGELYLENEWPRLIGPCSVRVGAGIGYYWSDYIEKEDSYRASGDDENWGTRLSTGITWHALKCLDIMLDGEYRWLEFSDYEDGGRDLRFVSPGNPPVEVDLSGFAIRLGVAWRF
ncbi:MAG: hypothetical protein K9N51_06390 [Candidatus Pacebacteria bacterium]|nr:hypothetical protein [Candidatus Paceibacterota bacterium]